ncbi:hypothetical protein LX15_001575 [Streptoalloteichus tenebrarius]|uniref:Uncharacterized protein n=1 Tax=Streptoalloteichus tenebrarius (strain ATCC 17920 / DSM 40477 / JCM 4838 / CBS 697.72 / NBRC 16177 / NCIMB 11028 / NRRL B-12390 / A12253. 1 / ISP 5477) TaxID=1933 RepID=A0ABT1HQU2_STRSD|nr:hypothetical protein [Streptoalloteichus tenebrarius]MCP2257889.1 hypothetical protein [Streptoalloteichus tenebrarius]BFE99748.1 hypothetical protein GCM10020241_14240 [Streptoalloteichus tenebrarius]
MAFAARNRAVPRAARPRRSARGERPVGPRRTACPVRLALGAALALVAALLGAPPAVAADPRIDLRVLLVTDGQASVEAIRRALQTEGVPTTVVELSDRSRPTITPEFLADQVDGVDRAKFQAVVLPNASAPDLGEAERVALADYERRFGVRELAAFSWPEPGVGLQGPRYAGALDGVTATVATGGPFRYLRGAVQFEDVAPGVAESYGYLAQPLPDDPAVGRRFEPLLTAPIPGTSDRGVLAGVLHQDGRQRLVLTYASNADQRQSQVLAHGWVSWLTKGVHLGHLRNYFSVHVDDVFLPDSRWSTSGNCTPGDDCPPGVPETRDIRMTPSDVTNLLLWQLRNNFQLELLYNGGGSDEVVQRDGVDPLTTAFLAASSSFRWANHTYSHPYLGCVQDFTVRPWRCATDPATGQVLYVSQQEIAEEITKNVQWARAHGLAIRPDELVTGEHSGMLLLPQQPVDNPNLAPALAQSGIGWLGSDNSRDSTQRAIGPATTVPRHPMNVFYNVATAAEEVDEYNWIYTSRADGGSGICDDHPQTTTCIKPLDPARGYGEYIVPLEVRTALRHMLANDPRPHYVHQSNLAEERILYPVLEGVLKGYRDVYAANAPVVNPRLSEAGRQLQRQAAWRAAVERGDVEAYQRGAVITVRGPAGIEVPLTVPEGSRVGSATGAAFGEPYGGERSAFTRLATGALTVVRPATATG